MPILPATFSDTFQDDELVYTSQAVYEFSDTVKGYASYTHGFKSGGFNLDSTAAVGGADPRFDSEKVDALELGVKSEFANRRVRLNATLFDYDIEDFQVLEFTGVQFRTFNVPKAQSRGAELELSAVAGQHVTLNVGYTYADSEYPEDCAGDLEAASVQSLCGAKLTNAPENVVSLGPTGMTPSATGSWSSRPLTGAGRTIGAPAPSPTSRSTSRKRTRRRTSESDSAATPAAGR